MIQIFFKTKNLLLGKTEINEEWVIRMSELVEKVYSSIHGEIYYYSTSIDSSTTILFIHGLGENKNWFEKHYYEQGLEYWNWIVPVEMIGENKMDEVAKLKARVAELEKENAGLRDSENLLIALQGAGVDNWEGYDDAITMYQEME